MYCVMLFTAKFAITLYQQQLKFPSFKHCHFCFTTLRTLSTSYRLSNSIDAESLYTSLLHKSTSKAHLNQIHSRLHTHGLHENGFIITKFIHVCSNFKEIDYARQLFDNFPNPYVFLWNAIIRGYSLCNMPGKVVEMYSRMQRAFVAPDEFTFPYVLKACGGLMELGIGRAVQAQILIRGFDQDEFLQSGILSFYVKCGEIGQARVAFDGLDKKTVVAWTSIISGFTSNGEPGEALRVFRDMRGAGVKPDWITLVSVLKAYSDMEDLKQGTSVHGLVIKFGFEVEPDLGAALVSLYAKCGQIMAAKSLFNQMEIHNVILLNAMISGFARNGFSGEALKLFQEMLMKNIEPDVVTVQSSILACAQLGSLEQAKWMDNYVKNSEYEDNMIVNTALIDMYAKCGGVELARQVFNRTVDRDVFVWSAMIVGYGLNGFGREAIELFNEMKKQGVRPNDVTFIGLITACSHSGLVADGWEIFQTMREYGVEPREKHYAGIVDMLGRAGHLKKAYDFIKTMPVEPSVSVWGALLSACKTHRDVILGEYAAEKLFALDPLHIGHYVQLSNLYASARMWDGVAKVRVLMQSRGMIKELGYSECFQVAGNEQGPLF